MNDYEIYGDEATDIINESTHLDSFIDGFESIVSQSVNGGILSITGTEGYCIGVMNANGVHFNEHAGIENFITEGIRKLYEMIKAMLKKVKDFFFPNKQVKHLENIMNNVREQERQIDEYFKRKPRNSSEVLNGCMLDGKEMAKIILNPKGYIINGLTNKLESDLEGNLNKIDVRKVCINAIAKRVSGNNTITTKAKEIGDADAVAKHCVSKASMVNMDNLEEQSKVDWDIESTIVREMTKVQSKFVNEMLEIKNLVKDKQKLPLPIDFDIDQVIYRANKGLYGAVKGGLLGPINKYFIKAESMLDHDKEKLSNVKDGDSDVVKDSSIMFKIVNHLSRALAPIVGINKKSDKAIIKNQIALCVDMLYLFNKTLELK